MKKIFLSLAILFFCAQTVYATHNWVWSGENIEVYVEDTSIEWEKNGAEFTVKVIDVIGKSAGVSYLNFYEREDSWYYGIVGKREIMPVTYANASGNILDFAKKFSPVKAEEENFDEE